MPVETSVETTVADVVKLLDKYKAYAAFLAPLLVAIATAVASWIISGEFNDNEIRAAAGGAILAVVSSIATFLQPAGKAEVAVPPISPAVVVPPVNPPV